MRRPAIIGGIALALVAGTVLPAQADTPRPSSRTTGRFTQHDIRKATKIVNLPADLRRDTLVNALVELTGAPVTVQQNQAEATGARFDATSVERRVRAEQAGKDAPLRAAGATVEGRLTHVLNAVRVRVRVRDLPKVAAIPGVRKVQVSQTVRVHNAAADRYTGVDTAWQDLGLTGKGMVVGVIDTGIDYTHADFGGAGTAAAYQAVHAHPEVIDPAHPFPTAKVIGGWDFVGDSYDADTPGHEVPVPDPNPIPCESHGTHVAGTAAGSGVTAGGQTYGGPYNAATLASTSFSVAPGSAPEAKLRAYKVFGCDGTANDDVIVAAIDQAVKDGVNVINMSLGSTFGTKDSLDAQAVDTATASGVLVVASAGNEGAGAYVTGAPAAADTALSVAAVDASRPTFPGVDIALPGGTVHAQNSNGGALTTITGELAVVGGDGLGCAAADYTPLAGKIVVTTRGVCARVDRAVFGQQAGALAVIMINNGDALPPFEGQIPGATIPFVGVTAADGETLKAAAGSTVSLSAGADITNTGYRNFADFTSAGPRRLDSALKPDISAPGVSVVSAGMGTGTGTLTISGTSMASPHTAGVAALVRQAHPTWTPGQVKAAMVSTADPTKVLDYAAQGGPVRGGSGLVQARRASDTVAYAWTADGRDNLSFGASALRQGVSVTRNYRITNTSRSAITYDLKAEWATPRYGAALTISPATVTVPAGSMKVITVKLSLSTAAVAALPGATSSDGGALVDLAGAVVATPRGTRARVYPLRTAFLWVPKPLSDVRAESPKLSAAGTGTMRVTNPGEHSGTADVYAWELSDPAGDVADPEVADIVDLGVQSLAGDVAGLDPQDRLLVFAVNQAGGTSTQATREVDIAIDTNNDGSPDFITFAADTGLVLAGSPDGTMSSFTVDLRGPSPVLTEMWGVSAPANGSVMELPVSASGLGLTDASGPFAFSATGYTVLDASLPGDGTTAAKFDAFHPVVSTGGFVTVPRHGSVTIPASVDSAQRGKQTALGWLVVTLDDASGRPAADRVRLPAR